LTTAGFHTAAQNLLLSITTNPTFMLIIIMALFLVLGTFMEALSTIVLFMPVVYPIALQVGIDPVVLSVCVVMMVAIGLVTPPEGMCLFIACDFLKVRVWDAMIKLIPFIVGMLVVIALCVAFPILITGPASLIK